MDKKLRDTVEHYGDKAENKFDQAKGWIKEKWGWMTDDDLLELEGKTEKIKAKLKDHYGDLKWEAEYQKLVDNYPDFED